VPRTINEGIPIVTALPRSECAESFRSLAAFYVDGVEASAPEPVEEPVAAAPHRGRLFGRRSQ
jgi:MinD-like ATPase involved in chromosome partitioning or flagellar assembly